MVDASPSASRVPAEAETSQIVFDLWSLVRRRRWHVIGSVVLGLFLGAVYLAQATRIYRVTTKVLVLEKTPAPLPFDGRMASERVLPADDYLTTHASLIRTPRIVSHAIDTAHLDRLPSLRALAERSPGIDLTEAILKELVVIRDVKGARILKLTYDGTRPDDCFQVIRAIVDSYQSFIQETHKDSNQEIAKLLREAKDELDEQIRQKDREYLEFREENPAILTKSSSGISMAMTRLASLENFRSEASLKRAQVEGQLQALEAADTIPEPVDATSTPDTRVLLSSMANLLGVAANRGSGSGEEAALSAQIQTRVLSLMLRVQDTLVQYQADSPAMDALTREIAALRDFGEGRARMRLQELRLDLAAQTAAQQALQQEYEHEKDQMETVATVLVRDEILSDELKRLRATHAVALDRLKELRITENYGTITSEVVEPPKIPKRAVKPNALATMAVALFFGGGLGLGLAYLAEKTDKSFRSTQEIKSVLALPILGHIPMFAGEGDDRSVTIGQRIRQAPQSVEAEAYRTVRTGLCFTLRAQHCPIVQITSPAPGDGKSTLAANIAISLAQMKKKVLLIDADLRRPTLHDIFGVPRETGFSDLLAGQGSLEHATLATGIPGLWLLPCGPIAPNPAELLTSSGFQEMLDEARQEYDYVLIDTPPVLAVADASIVAAHADGVVLVVRVSKNGRPAALQARETLDSIGARVLGVVVNGVQQGSGAYGYHYDGSYAYAYSSYRPAGTNGNGHATSENAEGSDAATGTDDSPATPSSTE